MSENLTTDPITGTPWTLCGPSVTLRNGKPACSSCGARVTVNEAGSWEYAPASEVVWGRRPVTRTSVR